METSLEKLETTTAPLMVAPTPGHLIEMAINKDLDVEKLQKLMEMQREYNATIARKAFFEAFTKFQSNAPDLRKTKEVSFTTSTGGVTKYSYAPLAVIVRQIKQLCEDCSLTYRWEIKDSAALIEVTCIITHSDGHSERTSMSGNADGSGSKNPIQARGSTIEYLKRYTLIGAFGLSTADTDIDAQLPELDINKLHKSYMELYEKIVLKDESFRTKGDPDNWEAERSIQLYVQAIGKARQILTKLTVHD
jgi:hypothetical protein